ncbi:hypothetical protein SPRG_07648 [Saprolegnia parasitica CBS 223.65]|uniref:Uncharacterized protein n=1 Tax=Saprolegnia parasitica (strain CBS 223.65) TaxID=695850 RepID=A0A067CCM0_SAPPC|nr:hypothetical protein SPRG_07648 [Saprolegnia parasitica CBS 223.65]KDO26935.1 hypothetical protein SPRG_07648 [Saprolegnia parasitica CBS 223.65]|eukprot:XP_012202316.1 hypothetical protein SPRG_07648 [Saprolegnia parasitica CBS 223.65]
MASERPTLEQTSTTAVHAEPTDSEGNHDLIAHAVRKDGLTTAQKWKDHRMKIGRALGIDDDKKLKRKEQGFKKLRSAMDELGSLGVQVLSYQFDEKKNFGGWIIEGDQAGQVASEIDGFNGVSPAILFPTFVGQAQVNAIKLKNSISK